MFSLFLNDSHKDFWGNFPGDAFINATCQALKLNEGQVDLCLYMSLSEVPKHFEFDSEKRLIIKKEVTSQVEEKSVDSDGKEVVSVVEQTSLEVDRIIEPIVYFSKGIMIKPC